MKGSATARFWRRRTARSSASAVAAADIDGDNVPDALRRRRLSAVALRPGRRSFRRPAEIYSPSRRNVAAFATG